MAHAEKTVVINRPVQSVFDFVINGANNKLWRSSVLDIKPLGEAPYGAGSKFQQGLKGPGGRIAWDYEITECKPNELIGFQVTSGPARPKGIYRFDSQGAATKVTFVLDHETKQLAKLTDPALTQQVFQELSGAVQDENAPASAHLSQQEKQVMLLVSEGKTNEDIAKALFLGEGTVRNYVFGILSKLMEPMIQRLMDEEVGMLEELKAFLEKHV
jgi:hypothetical protein